MYPLNDKQVDYILNDIRRRGVEMEDLQLNLLDHICCIIEQNPESDGNFEDFYNKTIPKFFKEELWEIEEETINLLIFKHYYAMKKVMITAGTFGAFATIFGAFFKIMHWPGASPLLVLGLASLSLIFLPLMFSLKIKEKANKRDKFVLGTGSVVATFLLLTALFKIMHWPFTTYMIYISLGILLFVFLPLYFISGIKNPDTKVNTIVTSILIMAGTGLMMVLPNKQPSVRLSKATVNYMRNENTALKELESVVVSDTGKNDVSEAYNQLMASAAKLKDAIAKSISGVDFDTYLNDDEHIVPSALSFYQLDGFKEKDDFVSAVVNFETKSKKDIYTYEKDLGYEAPTRDAEIDYALMLQPHIKDLVSFITNLQAKAALSLLKNK